MHPPVAAQWEAAALSLFLGVFGGLFPFRMLLLIVSGLTDTKCTFTCPREKPSSVGDETSSPAPLGGGEGGGSEVKGQGESESGGVGEVAASLRGESRPSSLCQSPAGSGPCGLAPPGRHRACEPAGRTG